ncbi:hypothetical protein ANCDUO_01331 [Ancylostoma duodenale]|uniref:Uncharacterized protein n=1 Tax=Ancylostoma duodenale TaxID=51022 RepID=A0A0C2DEG1_9BILA|nr:hypothetical protein ANCDUO_01331 [Ancylostoma duodenale]
MVKRAGNRTTVSAQENEEMPAWARSAVVHSFSHIRAREEGLVMSTTTFSKVRGDSQRIDEKLGMITWIGIDEQIDEDATRRFDHEILKEVVYTSGDNDLRGEFDEGRVTSYRFPSGKPRGPGVRGRIIKIPLAYQHEN